MYAVPCFLVIALAFLVTTDGGALQADQRECRFKPKLPKCRRQPPGRLGQGGRFRFSDVQDATRHGSTHRCTKPTPPLTSYHHARRSVLLSDGEGGGSVVWG